VRAADGVGWRLVRKIALTLATGGATYLLTNLTRQPQIWVLTMSVFVGGVVLVVQFLVDVDNRLDRSDQRQVAEAARMRRLVGRRFAKVSKATELFGRVEAAQLRTGTVVELVQYATRLDLAQGSLLAKLTNAELRRTSAFLRQIVDNLHADYPGEEQDWLFALVDHAASSIKATSTIGPAGRGLVDEGFWRSREAVAYLARHRDAVRRRGVRAQRIFIPYQPEVADEPEFRGAIQRNTAAGIQVRVLPWDAVPRERPISIDFILFDDEISYELVAAAPLGGEQHSLIMSTQLELRADLVHRRTVLFDELWALAKEP
jgi:hypothetical protein